MRRMHPWKSPVLRLLLAVLWGAAVMTACVLPAAGLLLVTAIPEWLLVWMADAFWCIGAFLAGNKAGFHGRRRGILTGLLCGGLLCLVLLVVCVLMKGTIPLRVLVRCILLLAAGMCGGVRGVNRKLTGPPY